jgi:hypothetical protein
MENIQVTVHGFMKYIVIAVLCFFILVSCNPFAPGLDDAFDNSSSLINDQRTSDGVFQNLKYAYTVQDTSIYGQMFDGNFTFLYRDYDRGVDVSWGRDEEIRATYGLFQNVQRLDLVWNNVTSSTIDSSNTLAMISRSFNLTVTFNPSDIVRVDGYAILTLERPRVQDAWMIVRWRDESNF